MARAINDFVNRLARNRSNEGFFWFAGHGVQIGGENYMLPIDVISTNEVEARHSSFSVRRLIESLDQVACNKANIVVLDACRDNPFPNIPGAFRNITRGLGVIQNLPPDLLIIFSTAPAAVAAIIPVPPRAAAPQGFVRVDGGTFQMGSCPSGQNVTPVRNVTVSLFYMSRHPVTQREWVQIMGSNPSGFRGDNRPVERVSWFDAIEFANAKSLRSGLTPAYTISGSGENRTVGWNRGASGYRLPTEAEWEFASRGGTVCRGNFRFSGSNTAGEVAWYNGNSAGSTQEVGLLKPNALGLYDMSGNVRE